MKRLRTEEEAFQRMLEGDSGTANPQAESLVTLVHALERGRGAQQPGPALDFQSVLRRKLIAEAERTVALASWRVRAAHWLEEKDRAWRRSFRVVTATGLAAAMMLGSGAMFASANTATPADGIRYMFDRAAEAAHEAATRGSVPRGYLKMDFARERLEEVETMAAEHVDVAEHYQRALGDMDNDTLDATKLLVTAARDGAGAVPLERLSRFTIVQRQRLENLLERKALPASAVPAARDSVDILLRVGDRVGAVIAGCPCPTNPLEVSPTGSTVSGEPSGVACACEQPGGGNGGSNEGGNNDDGNNNDGNNKPPPDDTTPPADPNTIPDIDGITLDDELEEMIEDLIDNGIPGTSSPVPLPVPSVLPSGLPSVPAVLPAPRVPGL